VDLGWVNMRAYNYFVSGPKFTNFLSPTWEAFGSSLAFPISDISIRSGNIRDPNLKLSEIARNFGRFLPSQILGRRAQKVHRNYYS